MNIKSKSLFANMDTRCGKQLMNMIGGLIKTDNQIIQFNNDKTLLDEKFGYVFQTSDYSLANSQRKCVALVCEKKITAVKK